MYEDLTTAEILEMYEECFREADHVTFISDGVERRFRGMYKPANVAPVRIAPSEYTEELKTNEGFQVERAAAPFIGKTDFEIRWQGQRFTALHVVPESYRDVVLSVIVQADLK